MVIAVASEWGENFSRYAFFRVENGRMKEREIIPVPAGGVEELAKQLIGLEADILIAPKLAGDVEQVLMESGVNVISGIVGKADAVAAAYLNGTLEF